MNGLPNGLFEFQEECVNHLLDATWYGPKNTSVIKAPTGAGKTIILIDYIDKFFAVGHKSVCFVWLCPGKGDLEEQSRLKMVTHAPYRRAKTLPEVLRQGFQDEDTCFINWEAITKRGNKAIAEGERKNLYERIAQAHLNGIEFVLIVDEEHSNDTRKAQDIIDAFAAVHTVRVSATAKNNERYDFYEIPEEQVITSGLITRALYINEGVQANANVENEHAYLIELADSKRKAIVGAYRRLGMQINPLVLIQFPDMSTELIERVEGTLASMGYTYANGTTAKWMSHSSDKINIMNIEMDNAKPMFLLMKQAIATGWDCPRAKILVKLRENMSEDFTIQTVGRLRRMPQARHYDDALLDNCYLYTFDEKFREGIKQEISTAFDVKEVFLKQKCKTFSLEKQLKNLDVDGLGERETYLAVQRYFVQKYNLGTDVKMNRTMFEVAGYEMTNELIRTIRQGKFVTTDSILDAKVGAFIATRRAVNTHQHGIELMHAIDAVKSAIGMKQAKVKTILERMFRANTFRRNKLLSLDTKDFYAFVINNEDRLVEDFRGATSQMTSQDSFVFQPKTSKFSIPEQDFVKFDPSETDVVDLLSNAYEGYLSSVLVEGIRSKCERLFERYCEGNDNVDWVYKNGDSGQQYFSIVYVDGLRKQWLFYPDYIVKLHNGQVWVIETKGGEQGGKSKNIDRQVENKFEAFKYYAERKNLRWGFVRDRNEVLKINNSQYADDLHDQNWKSLSSAF